MRKAKFQMETLACPSCIKKIERALSSQAGVVEAQVLFNSSKVKVVFDDDIVNGEELKDVVKKLGYTVLDSKVV